MNKSWSTDTEFTASVITMTSSSLSFLGGIFILYTNVKIKHLYDSPPRKLLVNITLADVLLSSFYFVGAMRTMDFYGKRETSASSVGGLQSDIMCRVQSFFSTYGSIASFLWTDILAIHLFSAVKLNVNSDLTPKKLLVMNIVGWVVPGVIMISAVSSGILGEDNSHTNGPWCWIQINKDSNKSIQTFRLFMYGKAYELLTYTITSALYIWMKVLITKAKRDKVSWVRGDSKIRNQDEKFWLTWIVLLVLRMPGTARTFIFWNRGYTTNLTDAQRYIMYYQSFGDAGQAFFNCIIYCLFDSDVRDFLKESFSEYIKSINGRYDSLNNVVV